MHKIHHPMHKMHHPKLDVPEKMEEEVLLS